MHSLVALVGFSTVVARYPQFWTLLLRRNYLLGAYRLADTRDKISASEGHRSANEWFCPVLTAEKKVYRSRRVN